MALFKLPFITWDEIGGTIKSQHTQNNLTVIIVFGITFVVKELIVLLYIYNIEIYNMNM